MSDSKLIEIATKRYESAKDHWSDIHKLAREDLDFLSGKPGCMWDEKSYASRTRKNLPALQIDRLTQYVNQVSNDIRMNTPSINVIPHSQDSDVETAEVFQGKIRDIEQKSGADDAYDFAVNSAVKCGIGFLRIDHDYVDDESLFQELRVERVVNPLSIYLDPQSTMADGSDAKYALVLDRIPIDDFKARYPDAAPVSFGESDDGGEEESITVCEYFYVEEKPYTVGDGEEQTREALRRTVHRCHLSGQDVLARTTFPGRYIPLIPVYGEEAWFDGKRRLHSLIRKAKDPQRRYNFWASVEAELLMKAPKSTIIAVGGTVENYAKDYMDPDSAILLRYDQTDPKGNPAPPPKINPGPGIPAGVVAAMAQAADDIKATLGLYDAFVGQKSNETSGIAIRQRKSEGDRAVYHYGDNLVRSITQAGRILVGAIPEIYPEPRVVNIVGEEQDGKLVGINGAMVEGQERPFYFARGVYNVRVTTGASYATMREEAADFFKTVIQSQPELMGVAGDLLFKYMDFPGAQALSERLRKTIPPQLLDEETQDPQAAALAQENEQLKQALATIQAQLESKQADLEVKVMAERNDAQQAQDRNQIEVAKLNLEQQKLAIEAELKRAELALKAKEMELRAFNDARARASENNLATTEGVM